MKCIMCRSEVDIVIATCQEIAQEFGLRDRYVRESLGKLIDSFDKDLTDFVHNTVVAVLKCGNCGLLVRDETADTFVNAYRSDPYQPEVMDHLLRRYINEYRDKFQGYAEFLPPLAQILEVGSHVGGFLHVAGENGWSAEGIDIGKDVAAFANNRGYLTHTTPLEEMPFGQRQFDGVFILNCFEQMPNPLSALRICRDLLADQGVVFIRTPNAHFYEFAEDQLDCLRTAGLPLELSDPVVTILATSSLLGFPYQYGFSANTLERAASDTGFRIIRKSNSGQTGSHTEPKPRPAGTMVSLHVEQRWSIAAQTLARLFPDTLVGPWIEVGLQKI